MEQPKCSVCNRPLKNRESIMRGIGPVCAGRYGIERHPGLGVKFKLQEVDEDAEGSLRGSN